MSLVRPVVIAARPGIIAPMIGGIAGMFLFMPGLMLAPAIGLPVVDVPRALGGVFFADPEAAFIFGFALFFFGGAFVFPILFGLAWPLLRVGPPSVFTTALRGIIWGLSLWALTGVVLWIAGLLNAVDARAFHNPGFFGFGAGLVGGVVLLLGHVVYGLAIGLVSYMAGHTLPFDSIGWPDYRKAEVPPGGTLFEQPDFPEYPPVGER